MVIPLLENDRKNRQKWRFWTSKIHYPTYPQCKEVVVLRPFLGAIRMGIGANGVLVLKLMEEEV